MSGKQPKRKDRTGVDRLGRTELHYAANERRIEDAKELIIGGTDINAKDDNGWTPLHFAAQSNSFIIAELLLEAGAEADPLDSYGNTPLFRAVNNSNGKGEVIELLRRNGADPNRLNNYGQSPVKLAKLIKKYDVAKFFNDLNSSE